MRPVEWLDLLIFHLPWPFNNRNLQINFVPKIENHPRDKQMFRMPGLLPYRRKPSCSGSTARGYKVFTVQATCLPPGQTRGLVDDSPCHQQCPPPCHHHHSQVDLFLSFFEQIKQVPANNVDDQDTPSAENAIPSPSSCHWFDCFTTSSHKLHHLALRHLCWRQVNNQLICCSWILLDKPIQGMYASWSRFPMLG